LDIDSKQNIWVASISGLLKFDGQSWIIYDTSNSDLPNNELFAVEVDKEDNIWIGHSEDYGVTIFDRISWLNYNHKNSRFDAYKVKDIMFDKNNNPWLGTWEYIWTFQNGTWIQYEHIQSDYPEVYEVEVDKNNSIWFTSRRNGLFIYSEGSFRSYSTVNQHSYDGLAVDSNNNIWIFNNQNSLMHFNTVSKEWIVRDTNKTPFSSRLGMPHNIIVSKYNTLWITENRSIHNFNPETGVWKTFTAPDTLFEPNTDIGFTDSKLDRNNNFWFITDISGVFKLSDVITDVEVEQIVKNIFIYPNPTSTLLSYETNNITSIINQRIVDLSGKVLIDKRLDNTISKSIDVSKLQSGVYFLQLTDMKGVKYSKKFVVE
jgi:ligand-binding sensor domain-containing protein